MEEKIEVEMKDEKSILEEKANQNNDPSIWENLNSSDRELLTALSSPINPVEYSWDEHEIHIFFFIRNKGFDFWVYRFYNGLNGYKMLTGYKTDRRP